MYYGSPYPEMSVTHRPTEDRPYTDGREYRTEIYDANNVLLRKTESTWEPGTPLAAYTEGNINARVSQVVETLIKSVEPASFFVIAYEVS